MLTLEEMRLIENINWKSIDKDNMEFQGTISCYQKDALTKMILLMQAKVYGGAKNIV